VFPIFTDQIVSDLKKRGATVTYKTYDATDHSGVVTKAKPAKNGTAFVKKELG